MVASLSLPRDAWLAHPNYPHQVLLLGSHRNFRAMGQRLIHRGEAGESRSFLLNSFAWWKSAMGGHEHYEERKLYPFLEHKWGLNCDELREGHADLAAADALVRQARTQPELIDALQAHQVVLVEHLEEEERLVIPALLALERGEFELYTENPLPWSLREVPCHAGEPGCPACLPYRRAG